MDTACASCVRCMRIARMPHAHCSCAACILHESCVCIEYAARTLHVRCMRLACALHARGKYFTAHVAVHVVIGPGRSTHVCTRRKAAGRVHTEARTHARIHMCNTCFEACHHSRDPFRYEIKKKVPFKTRRLLKHATNTRHFESTVVGWKRTDPNTCPHTIAFLNARPNACLHRCLKHMI